MVIRFRYRAVLFALFLAVIMVRVVPFSPRGTSDPTEADAAAGLGKQLLYIAFFLALSLPAMRTAWRTQAIPIPFLLLLGFGALSLGWSAVPDVGGRRLAVTAMVAVAILLAVSQMRPKAVIDLLRWVTLALALATLASGMIWPEVAIHQAGDPEPSIVGAWRGIFFHKNLAGAVIGLGLVLAIEALVRERRLLTGGAGVAVAALALYLTGSRTSQVSALAAVVVLLAFLAANALTERNATRAVLLKAAVVAASLPLLVLAWFATDLQSYLLDPEAFTGRGQLWGLIGQLVAQRPWLGHGYESVFQVGGPNALSQLSSLEWIRHVPHSHNGLLDLLVTVGVVGLALYLWALVVDPWRRLARLPAALRETWQPLVAALMTYALTHSLMEGKMFSADSVEWAVLVLTLGISVRLAAIVRLGEPGRASRPDVSGG